MTEFTFPSQLRSHRRADLAVHIIGLLAILTAGGVIVARSIHNLEYKLVLAVLIYVLCMLISNVASNADHFSNLHDKRTLLRRIDHAAIYISISGTLTPFFVFAGTPRTMALL
ncbi:MAG: hemolysin III family protein [Pseudomonadota bacterium]